MANLSKPRPLGGVGSFQGPKPGTHFQKVVAMVKDALPYFANSSLEEGIKNEKALNGKLIRFIDKIAYHQGLSYFVESEPMEDEKNGASSAPDIGIYLQTDNMADDLSKITVFEAKRLSSNGIFKKRHREYVCGHEKRGKYIECGGIERFKLSLHGRDINYAGMIGYVQDGDFDTWLTRINEWICELSRTPDRVAWSEEEQLILVEDGHQVMQSKSMVYRTDDQLHLTHLWVNLISTP